MAGTVDDQSPPFVVQPTVHHTRWAHQGHGVGAAGDEGGRHGDVGAVELRGEGPAPVDVAIPVDAAGEAGAGELGGVVVELLLAEPIGELRHGGQAVDEPGAVGRREAGQRAVVELVDLESGEHAPHRLAGVGGEVGVGHAGLLEVEEVEEAVGEDRPHQLGGRRRRSGDERHAHAHHPGHPLRVQEGEVPHHHGPPVVPHERRPLGADVVEEGDEVVGEVDDVVVLDGGWPIRPAVAPLVGRQHVVAGLGQHWDLVAPGVRQVGKPVGQYHRKALAGLNDVQLDAVGGDAALTRGRVGGGHAALPAAGGSAARSMAGLRSVGGGGGRLSYDDASPGA